MSYCTTGGIATVNYSFGEVKKTVVINNCPIDISVNGSQNTGGSPSCWKFSGQGKYNDSFYNFFGCGVQASWHNNGTFLQPMLDGLLFLDGIYGVRYGSDSISQVNNTTPDANYLVEGSCPCLGQSFKISIYQQGKLLFSDTGTSPCIYTVACDNGCPPGQCKCHSDSYPGYCCLDCDSISNKISQIISQVKQLN